MGVLGPSFVAGDLQQFPVGGLIVVEQAAASTVAEQSGRTLTVASNDCLFRAYINNNCCCAHGGVRWCVFYCTVTSYSFQEL
jgi:hypothetical protein